MRKTFVIDTSVLLHHEDSIHGFAGHDLVIPMEVLEELDQFKVRQDSVGNASRYVNRFLDEIRELGSLKNGITLENQQTIFVISGSKVSHLPVEMDDIVDNKIIACAYNLHHQGKDVTLISRDINMRIKCDSLGMPAENYLRDKAKISRKGAYTGFSIVMVDDIDPFFDDGYIETSEDLMPNECILLKENSGQGSGLGIADGRGRIRKLYYAGDSDFSVQGISPRSKEQKFAMELLMDPRVAMVTLTGPAGSGKSLMGVAAAMEHFHNGVYERIIVSRPNHSTSKDIGYLPGTKNEKIRPWLGSIFDNFRFLTKDEIYLERMMERGVFEMESLSFIRGRSLPNTIFILDEAQNITIDEAKAVLTRMGENSKIILLGDLEQIDAPHITSSTSGLATVVEKFRDFELSGHITLIKGERSALATHAAKVL